MQFTPELYSLTAMTNMHVGSGKNNYGIIDNLIQRDVVSGHPTINSSSLKGAMREFFSHSTPASLVEYVFGSDPQSDKSKTNKQGAYRFFPAQLLSIPVRCDVLPFVNVTSPTVIRHFLTLLEVFNITNENENENVLKNWLGKFTGEPIHFEEGIDEMTIESTEIKAKRIDNFEGIDKVRNLLGDYPVLVSDEQFSELTGDNHLPVIARNHLENGISQNLWYEQILPRQSRFYFIVLTPDNNTTNKFSQFNEKIKKELIQIGGNASIGYGFSKISQI